MNVALTYWESLRRPVGRRVRTTWPTLLERLSVPREADSKDAVPGFALATFNGDRRALANVERVYAIGLDFDAGDDWSCLVTAFAGTAAFLHTTWSSTPERPRARCFILLSRAVTVDEYRVLYAYVAELLECEGFTVDRAASDPSRFWYLPAKRPGGSFAFHTCRGEPMPVPAVVPIPSQQAAPPPPMPRGPIRGVNGGASALERARAYLAKCPGAISGSGGHNHTFFVAQRLVRGFSLSEADAYALLANEWNPRCSPPWSEPELRRKVSQAASAGRQRQGDMLERAR
jgi:hypothetical protein